jgi:hypothetical protein
VQGGARAAFAKVCKMSVAGGCLQTLMTECSHGRVSVNSELGPRPHKVLFCKKSMKTALPFHYQSVNGKFLRFCEIFAGYR